MNVATRPASTDSLAQSTGTANVSAWWVGGLCLALAGVADVVLRHERGMSGDEPFYSLMATHPGAAHSFPYAYRIAVPWLVHVLPFSQTTGFQLQALVCIAVAGALLYTLLQSFSISGVLALGLALGFSISPNLLVVLLRHGRSIDPATTLVMVAGALFIVRRQRLALAITVLIGVAVKETSLFLVPFAYAVWARRPLDREAARDTALIAIAPVVGYVVLHLSVSAIGHEYTPYATGSFLHARLNVFRQVFTATELRRVALAYGPLWIAAPFALLSLPFARRGLVLVAECVAAMTVSYDAGRIIFLAVPVFFVAAAWSTKDRRRLATAMVACLFAVDVGYALYMQVHGVQAGLDTTVTGPIPLH
jgi:hypothetical protein